MKTVSVTTSVVGEEGSEFEGLYVTVTMGGVGVDEVGSVGARLATAALVALGRVDAVKVATRRFDENLIPLVPVWIPKAPLNRPNSTASSNPGGPVGPTEKDERSAEGQA